MNRFRTALLALSVAALAPLGAALSGGAVAGAAPKEPVAKPGHCPIVHTDANGNETVEYVPTGTRVGLLVCGADGNWKAGWLITEMTGGAGGTTSGGGVYSGGVYSTAR